MRHDAHGWWLEEAGAPAPLPELVGDATADVVVVGGGYTGLWTAWWIARLEPGASVVLLEADRCGHGPSGRNGGFLEAMWTQAHALRARFGDARARELIVASARSVEEVRRFCARERVDAWLRRGGYLRVSTSPAQDGAWRPALDALAALGLAGEARELSAEEVRSRCDSPLFRGGLIAPGGASVQPARLALGLRARLAERGVRIAERSPVRRLAIGPGGALAETPRGRVRAGAAVVAVGASTPALAPLARRLTVASSHVVLTEPAPGALAELRWTGGECITDCRQLLHYFRTTPDGRVLFGYAGGRIAWGARARGRIEVDPWAARRAAQDLARLLPPLAGARIERAWGGPIDVSPTHLPWIDSLPGGRGGCAAGFTGNGVGPSQLAGRALASLALGRRDAPTRLAIVDAEPVRLPPEPLRWAGGSLVRRALLAAEEREDLGEPPAALADLVRRLPARLGIHVGR